MTDFLAGETGQALCARLDERLRAGVTVLPPDPFRALRLTPRHAVRVVILGQDPYHGDGQANGLAFSVQSGVTPPPSLRNIFKEVGVWRTDRKPVGELEGWAAQGVLLLNTVLTVELGQPAAHAGWGWEVLTDRLIDRLAALDVVFLLWGSHAQAKRGRIEGDAERVLCCNHPSPLSATRGATPFLGSRVFEQANAWLSAHGQTPVNWAMHEKS
ncbi:uracil-DNA glycosylase [Comamonas serinivorans]|uniref:uracil-DNA glycosylase n=1 Tax=Comamonas serinivorans TaxID=1082851 RepID=UPI0030034958